MNGFYERLKGLLLRVLRVPPEPHPPAGSPGSLRVFRAGRNYYRLRLGIWTAKQAGVVIGFLFSLGLVHWLVSQAPPKVQAFHLERWLVPIELFVLAGAVIQAPFTWAMVRLEYELRWYLVTDRSLRLRHGVWGVREMTVSFANIQQVTLRQGPLQRLLGISDVEVKTAGGGSGFQGHQPKENFHTGRLHSVDNAPEIRELIAHRLRQLRDAGLGDHDDHGEHGGHGEHPAPGAVAAAPPAARAGIDAATLAAARELLAEARALRARLS